MPLHDLFSDQEVDLGGTAWPWPTHTTLPHTTGALAVTVQCLRASAHLPPAVPLQMLFPHSGVLFPHLECCFLLWNAVLSPGMLFLNLECYSSIWSAIPSLWNAVSATSLPPRNTCSSFRSQPASLPPETFPDGSDEVSGSWLYALLSPGTFLLSTCLICVILLLLSVFLPHLTVIKGRDWTQSPTHHSPELCGAESVWLRQ